MFDSRDFLRVVDAADPVSNFALALEQRLTQSLTATVSFRSDYSFFKEYDEAGMPLGIGDWNLYHVTLGGTYRKQNSEFALGVVYSFGQSGEASQVANFSDPTASNLLVGQPGETDADYRAVSVILGYTYFFM